MKPGRHAAPGASHSTDAEAVPGGTVRDPFARSELGDEIFGGASDSRRGRAEAAEAARRALAVDEPRLRPRSRKALLAVWGTLGLALAAVPFLAPSLSSTHDASYESAGDRPGPSVPGGAANAARLDTPGVKAEKWVDGKNGGTVRTDTFTFTVANPGWKVHLRWNGKEYDAAPTDDPKVFTYIATVPSAAKEGKLEGWAYDPKTPGSFSQLMHFNVWFKGPAPAHAYFFDSSPALDRGSGGASESLELGGDAVMVKEGREHNGTATNALSLPAPGALAASAKPLVDTSDSFGFGLWVFMPAGSGNAGQRVIAGQYDADSGAPVFQIGYDGEIDRFFGIGRDAKGRIVRVEDTMDNAAGGSGGAAKRAGQWVYLALRYDAQKSVLQLATATQNGSGAPTLSAGTTGTLAGGMADAKGGFVVGSAARAAAGGLPAQTGFVGRVDSLQVAQGYVDDDSMRKAASTDG